MKHIVFFLAAFLLLVTIPLGQGKERPKFPEDVLENAKQCASELADVDGAAWPDDVEVRQRYNRKDRFADIRRRDDGSVVVTVYPSTFITQNPELGDPNVGLGDPYAEGLLCEVLGHELMHKCIGISEPSVGLDAGCEGEYHSCQHLAIDNKITAQICSMVEALVAQYNNMPNGSARQALLNKIIGLCERHRRIEQKWNNEKWAARAKECCDGTASCAYTVACEIDVPRPPGCVFTDNIVIQPCEACGGF